MPESWDIEKSKNTYHIERWGNYYFDINKKGNLCVNPQQKSKSPRIDIAEVIQEMKSQNISFPAVIRFHDILRSQVKHLNETFRAVIEDAQYKGKYNGVYPIKVNQMKEVVEEIVDAGTPYDFGLEAGSKPELLSVLAYNTNENALTILNGYKDNDYLKLALLGRKLGRNIIVVIEKFSELESLIKLSKEMNVAPIIGLRAKISVKGRGKWANSSGDKAKFGLSVPELIQAVELIKKHELLNCLKLFHFHMGSQIPDIRTIKDAINEGARIFAKLVKMGTSLEYFDVGGGLGIDYDGSKSSNDSSTNYELKSYAEDIVYTLKQVCDLEGVAHPNIVSESGRFITAHHSCVITNVIGKIETAQTKFDSSKKEGEHHLVDDIRVQLSDLNKENYQVIFNEALQIKENALNAFKLGVIELEERAKIESLYWEINQKIYKYTKSEEYIPEGLWELEHQLSPQYLCNFSVFQSAADSWAIDQVLPVIPIQRHLEKPNINCTIADITCDSDGKIDKFVNPEETASTLPMHELKKGEEYFVGIFLTGAYQDVMGDMHNLFGRLNEVHVFSDDDDPSNFYIEESIKGSSAQSVLSTMQYYPEHMAYVMKKNIDKQVQLGKIRPRESVKLVDFFEDCLDSYTYLS